jgi:putative membrane protein
VGWHGYQMAGWAWPMMGLFWIIVILLIVLTMRWLIPGVATDKVSLREAPHGDALAILDERFARGEIDTAEYDERKRALRAKR